MKEANGPVPREGNHDKLADGAAVDRRCRPAGSQLPDQDEWAGGAGGERCLQRTPNPFARGHNTYATLSGMSSRT